MIRKSHIGKVCTIGYTPGNKEVEHSGIVLDYGSEWVLLRSNPEDYILDGYLLLRKEYITSISSGSWERFKDKLFAKKKEARAKAPTLPLNDIESLLQHLTEKYVAFQFEMRSDKACYLGRVKSINGSRLKIYFLGTRSKWTSDMPEFVLGNIRSIEFDTDYINSLLLMSNKSWK